MVQARRPVRRRSQPDRPRVRHLRGQKRVERRSGERRSMLHRKHTDRDWGRAVQAG